MTDSLRPRSINWSMVGVLVTVAVYVVTSVIAFVVVREQGNYNTDSIGKLNSVVGEQGVAIQRMREDRSIETKIYDLTLEVRLLRQQVEMSNKEKKRQ